MLYSDDYPSSDNDFNNIIINTDEIVNDSTNKEVIIKKKFNFNDNDDNEIIFVNNKNYSKGRFINENDDDTFINEKDNDNDSDINSIKNSDNFIIDRVANDHVNPNNNINDINDDIVNNVIKYNKQTYIIKNHPLMFLTPLHLSFILKSNNDKDENSHPCPIRCRICGSYFTRDLSKMSFTCTKKRHGCNTSILMADFKAYLMDLHNKNRLFLEKRNNDIYLIFSNDESNNLKTKTLQVKCPNSLNKKDLDNISQNLFYPLIPKISKKIINKKLFSLRNCIWCTFDYYRPFQNDEEMLSKSEMENSESVLDIFFEKIGTPLSCSSSKNPKNSKRNRRHTKIYIEKENVETRKKKK